MNHLYVNLFCIVLGSPSGLKALMNGVEEDEEEEVIMSSSEDDVNPTGTFEYSFFVNITIMLKTVLKYALLFYKQPVYYRGLTQAVFLYLRLRHATLNISKNIAISYLHHVEGETEEVERWDRVLYKQA